MNIRKETEAARGGTPTEAQLAQINRIARAELKAEEVYVFSLRLCDDQVDRDNERFDTAALPELAKLFVGKSGIVDHRWSAENQVARIFEASVEQSEGVSFIKAWAYIRRGGAGDEWIADIEAGIKKEVSVGCAMGSAVCSICGQEAGTCGHRKGELYDGQRCCSILREPVDAYEFSFVAVPAQREAGVLKGMHPGGVKLKELADRYGAQEEYRGLWKLAQLGREYEKQLEDEVVTLCLSLELGIEEEVLRSAAGKMAPGELKKFRAALTQQAARRYPVRLQLGGKAAEERFDGEYLI